MAVTPMFPLQVAMLPGEELPLRIFEPRYTALVSDCLATDDPAFGVVLIAAGREVGGGDVRSDVGTMAYIAESADLGEGRYRLPMGPADKYAVLAAPTAAARVSALSEAVDTVTAMVEFQLSE